MDSLLTTCVCGQPALVQCLCQSPASVFCPVCLAKHVFCVAGNHRQQALTNSSPCQQCNIQPSVCLCSCNRFSFCEVCYNSHKSSGKHWRLPLLQGNAAEKALTLTEALLEGLEQAKSAQQVAVKTLNEMMQAVHKYKLKLLQRMREDIGILEKVIQEAVREIAASCSAQAPPLSAELQALLSFSPSEQRAKLRFVTITNAGAKDLKSVIRRSMDVLVCKQLCALPPPHEAVTCLPLLESRAVSLSPWPFNSSSQVSIEDFDTSDSCTAWCLLPYGTFLATGTAHSLSTFSINFQSKCAVPLADTLDVHCFPGIILVDSKVYLLGGLKGVETSTVELYDLYENAWVYLPSMIHCRAKFQPCHYQRFLYIFGGTNAAWTQNSERYSLDSACFEPLGLSLPGGLCTLAYCQKGVFYMFIRDDIWCWEPHKQAHTITEDLELWSAPFMSPLCIENSVYFYAERSNRHYLMRFNLESTRIDTLLQFEEAS